ncbi:MAG TPA: RDD family protein [Polyangiaceae bacterium]|jgi:uncharacterized RDD family membrane protein YckC|nr:RDD family protein [Polyangiaceae bacterium]
MYQDPQNPYAPPQNYGAAYGYGQPAYGYGYQAGWDQMLASRGSRLGARLLDGLVTFVTMIPGLVWLISASSESSSHSYSSTYDPYGTSSYSSGPTFEDMMGPFALMLIPALAFTIYNWVLISKRGQTLGKKWLNIKIVKLDGSPVDFVSGVILREWVQGFINNLPWIGGIVALIDACMIFSQDQQCMHDKIAKTKVVLALPDTTSY